MTEADLGLADAYIQGDFSFEDKEEGLLNLFLVRCGLALSQLVLVLASSESSLIYLQIFIANRESDSSASGLNKKRFITLRINSDSGMIS